MAKSLYTVWVGFYALVQKIVDKNDIIYMYINTCTPLIPLYVMSRL